MYYFADNLSVHYNIIDTTAVSSMSNFPASYTVVELMLTHSIIQLDYMQRPVFSTGESIMFFMTKKLFTII